MATTDFLYPPLPGNVSPVVHFVTVPLFSVLLLFNTAAMAVILTLALGIGVTTAFFRHRWRHIRTRRATCAASVDYEWDGVQLGSFCCYCCNPAGRSQCTNQSVA